MSRYHISLLVVFLVFWVWAAIDPLYRDGWLLENYLIFIFVPFIILLGRYFQLSNVSYTLIAVFMILHVIGSHYTYAEVPFGHTLQDWTGADRNMYDRLVHYSFGFLLAYPIREMFLRVTKSKGLWGYYLPLEMVAAFSGLYEIVEWLAAARVDPQAGLAFLGTQGDIWDAQKDMLLATMGSFFAMAFIWAVNFLYDKNFWKEIKASMTLGTEDSVLGEVRLKEILGSAKGHFTLIISVISILAVVLWVSGYVLLNSLIENL